MTSLCLEYGNPPQAANIYNDYGLLLCSVMGEIEEGYQFGNLVIKLLEKNNNPELDLDKTSILFHFYSYIWCWKNQFNSKTAYEQIFDVLQQAIDSENNDDVGKNLVLYCLSKFFGGCDLEEVKQDCEKYIILAIEINRDPFAKFLEVIQKSCHKFKRYSLFSRLFIN